MKYIVTEKSDGTKEIFVFSKNIDHDAMAESIARIRTGSGSDWRRERRTPVSAGFVNCGMCHGRSETLNLDSQESDTLLLPL